MEPGVTAPPPTAAALPQDLVLTQDHKLLAAKFYLSDTPIDSFLGMRPVVLGYYVNGNIMIVGHSQTTCPGPQRTLFVRSKSVVCRQIAGETLVVPIRGKVGDLASIYTFNSTGSKTCPPSSNNPSK
jgi:hypothetical protein